jgi:hypothetical protein
MAMPHSKANRSPAKHGEKKASANNDGLDKNSLVAKRAHGSKSPRTSALDDALELLLGATYVGRLKQLPKEGYGEELRRVRILQRIVAKAVAEGSAPPHLTKSLARHFDTVLEGL